MLHRTSQITLLVLGTLWSLVLVVGGASLALSAGGLAPTLRTPGALGGLSAVFAGQFVFVVVVAGRLAPGAHRGLAGWIEIGLGAGFVLGVIGTAAAWAAGATA